MPHVLQVQRNFPCRCHSSIQSSRVGSANRIGEPTPRAGRRMARHPRSARHADCGADWIGQDARGVSQRARRALRRGTHGTAPRRSPHRLRLSAQGAERGHPQEPRGAAARHSRDRAGNGARRAGDHRRRAHRRHHRLRAGGDAAQAAAHPRDDAGVAVSAAHRQAKPRAAADRAHGHRRRDSRRHRDAPRRASVADARAARTCRRDSAASGSDSRRRRSRSKTWRDTSLAQDAHTTRTRPARSSTKAIAARWIWRSKCPVPRSMR